jgi:hypothetical protein
LTIEQDCGPSSAVRINWAAWSSSSFFVSFFVGEGEGEFESIKTIGIVGPRTNWLIAFEQNGQTFQTFSKKLQPSYRTVASTVQGR